VSVRDGSPGPLLVCVGTYFLGGVSSWAIRLVRAARARGVDARLALPWPVDHHVGRGTSRTLLDEAPDLAGPEFSVRLPVAYATALSRRRVRERRLAEALAPHSRGATLLLNNDWQFHAAAAWLARWGAPPRAVNVVHADEPMYYQVERYYAPLLVGSVAVSERIARALGAAGATPGGVGSAPGRPIAVIPCGVPIDGGRANVGGDCALRLITACRIEERQKRVLDVPRVATALRNRGVPFRWRVFGDGPDRATLAGALRDAGLSECVTLEGWRPHADVAAALLESDVYVQTSNFEGTPVSVMEAMVRGVVPVMTRVSGTDELLGAGGEGRAGFLLGVGDADGIAAVLARAVGWPADRTPSIPLELVGGSEARLDALPNWLAVLARSALSGWARRPALHTSEEQSAA
jgi:glycosyltransferase involved in cell wall biosynthesis